MRKIIEYTLIPSKSRWMCAGLIALSQAATAQSVPTTGQGQALMNRQQEIALALSACPSSVASQAAVYVLDAAGYVKVRDGQNGFTAIVQHSMPSSQEPQCMDAEGARTFLPRMLKVAELRAQGKTADEIQTIVAAAVRTGVFQPPARAGVIYMLSAQNVVPNTKGEAVPFPPHVMFFGMHLTNRELGVSTTDLGADGNPNGPTFVAGDGPFSLIIVPVGAHVEKH